MKILISVAVALFTCVSFAGKIQSGKASNGVVKFDYAKEVTMVNQLTVLGVPSLRVYTQTCKPSGTCGLSPDCYIPLPLLKEMNIDPLNLAVLLTSENDLLLQCIYKSNKIAERLWINSGSVRQ